MLALEEVELGHVCIVSWLDFLKDGDLETSGVYKTRSKTSLCLSSSSIPTPFKVTILRVAYHLLGSFSFTHIDDPVSYFYRHFTDG